MRIAFLLLLASICSAKELPEAPKPKMTLAQAITEPRMLAWESAFVASNVFDEESTQHCIASHDCIEGNPLVGQGRAQAYTVGAAFAVATILGAAELRKHGHTKMATAFLASQVALHVSLAIIALRR